MPPATAPVLHGRLHASGWGKDSTSGHWELMGVVQHEAPPTYPDGFPEGVLGVLTAASGRAVICNRPCNGIGAIEDYGEEHVRSGALIVYTSQDSVLQIAAHEAVVPAAELYEICARVRAQLPGEHAVRRVIARPFGGAVGAFTRTEGRRDLSVRPPSRSYLEELGADAIPVHTVGKVGQLFAGVGIDVQHPGPTNAAALGCTGELVKALDAGLVFTNLIDTDQVYGHRHDAAGFAAALATIDAHVGRWLARLDDRDLLIVTADHGCDVTAPHTDHTREHVPLLARFEGHRSRRHDGPMSDVGASVLDWLAGRAAGDLPGRSFCENRCLSSPRSRRSAASSRPISRVARWPGSRSSIRAGPGRSPPRSSPSS